METFLSIHQDCVIETLTTFDRLIFKGHLTMLYPQGAFARLLHRQGVLLKDFKPYVEGISQRIKQHAEELARQAGRPIRYLEAPMTAKNGQSKEALAQQMAAEDGLQEGLIGVFYTLEPCSTFTVRGNRQTQKLEVIRRRTKCLHFYFYYLDRELGFMHIRLQSWFPFQIQVYVNGRECLSRALDRGGIGYERYDNCFTHIDDLAQAQAFCEKFAHFAWPGVLNALAERVNPILETIQQSGFGSYYWVADQAEIATDIMFKDRTSLEVLLPDLFEHAILKSSCQDVLRFLGRKLHGNFQGEATTSLKKRSEGWRAKHTMKRNSLKLYDKGSILRVETTINNPSEFKICQQTDAGSLRWAPSPTWMTCAGAIPTMANAAPVSTHSKPPIVTCLLPSCLANSPSTAPVIAICAPSCTLNQQLLTKKPNNAARASHP
jgi:hypothetical protein